MSVPVPFSAVSSPRAGGTSPEDVEVEDDRDMVATIPIQVPLPTFASAPDRDATSAPEAPAPTPVLSDAELLAAFVQRRDADAFTQIVERHGPMVYRVALRAVSDGHLADDVYQAAFLVLAQSARQIKHGEVLPAWLHGTARNIARRALSNQHTERQRLFQIAEQTLAEKGGAMIPSTAVDPFEELARLNEQQLLDEELQQLPESSRTPLVLFYLEEKTQAEIAQLMGLTVEAVEGRLRRAKQELRQRLVRRGVFLSTIVAAATVLTPSLATAAPASTLVSSTIATALGTTALGGTLASTSLATGATTAAKLAAQEVAAMSAASKATAILITTVASTTVATGLMFGAMVSSMSGGGTGATPVAQAANVSPPTLGRFEIPDEGFSGLGEEPVLLALGDPEETIETERDNSPHNVPKNPADAEIRAVIYQITDLNEEQQDAVVKYAQSWAESVTNHPKTQSVVVRGNTEAHQQIAAYLASQRKMRKQIGEFILTLEAEIQRKLKTHSDNHPDILKLQSQRRRLERILEQEDLRVHEQADLATLADKRSESRIADAAPRMIESPETTVKLPLHHAGKLEFTSRVTVIDGFDSTLLLVKSLSPTLIRVEAKTVGETAMQVTCETGKKYRVQVQVLEAEDLEAVEEAQKRVQVLEDRITRLNKIVDFQRQQMDELQNISFDVPDGQITSVDKAIGTVWLNLGQKDGLRPQVTFSVYGTTHPKVARDPQDVKANIEVVEVRENSSIARVVEEDSDRPIVVGDVIFSPAWSSGIEEHFALVGNGDLNGDGNMDAKDRLILKNLLTNSGAKLDLEITDDGQRLPAEGKLTVQTKWLIVGDLGDPATAANDPEKLKRILAVQKQHDMLVQEAREHGMRIVSLKDFLTYSSFKPETRLYIPGANVPFRLKEGARNAGANPLAQASEPRSEPEPPQPKPASVAKTIAITEPMTEVELAVHDIRLLKFPVPIARAEVQYEPVLEVKSVRGQADSLHLRAITDGSCLLIVTGANDAVYRVGIKAGTPPKNRFREIDHNESKALNALQGQVSLEFPDNTLKEICRFIAQLHEVPVTLDTEDLKAAGADPDLRVSITAKSLTQAQALTTMLEKVKEPPLDFYVDGGAIHISTVAAMKVRKRLVHYRLASLSPEGQAAAEKYITPLATSVAPLEGDLLVDASVHTHKKFEEFLHGALRLESQRPARVIELDSATSETPQNPQVPDRAGDLQDD